MPDSPVPDHLTLVTKDVDATVAFYRRLGLTIPDSDADFEAHHRAAQLPGGAGLHIDSVEFAKHWDRGWQAGMGVLTFSVESRQRVDEIYGDLTRVGYHGQQEPYDAFWGARYAVVEDPEGNAVGIMSPIDSGRGSDAGFP